jgi:predicted nucleic acid-binding protein
LTPRLVVDASAILGLCFDDEDRAYGERILDVIEAGASVIVPAIWPLEITNGLLAAERKNRLDHDALLRFRVVLGKFSTALDTRSLSETMNITLPLARKHRLTAYDAAYLELALREQCPLASLDRQLVQACAGERVTVL